jgi:hypothetical protein
MARTSGYEILSALIYQMRKKIMVTQKHKLYNVWKSIRQRCFNANNKSYKNYGGRGISICEEWSSYDLFLNWALDNGYKDGLSIDRVNNDGNYEPSNCRFTNMVTQSRNTRKIRSNNTTGYRGVSANGNKYVARICVYYKIINLGYFDTAIEASYAFDNFANSNNLTHTRNWNSAIEYEESK